MKTILTFILYALTCIIIITILKGIFAIALVTAITALSYYIIVKLNEEKQDAMLSEYHSLLHMFERNRSVKIYDSVICLKIAWNFSIELSKDFESKLSNIDKTDPDLFEMRNDSLKGYLNAKEIVDANRVMWECDMQGLHCRIEFLRRIIERYDETNG